MGPTLSSLRAHVVESLGDPDAILILDETGSLKKGKHSAGVARQYTGTAGRIENCQIGVFLADASRHGTASLDRPLYPPREWAEDPSRCPKAGVPEGTAFATKARLAQAMPERPFAAEVPAASACSRALPVSRGQALPTGLLGPAGSPDQGV